MERDRRSSAQLLSSELSLDRVHSVLQSLVEAVIVVDVMGEVVLANAAAEKLLDIAEEDLTGRAISSVLIGDIALAVVEGLVEAEDDRAAHSCQAGVVWGERCFDVLVERVLSERSGQDFGFVVVFIDATNRFELARTKDEFLSAVSHELRTPLTNICAYAEILSHLEPNGDEWRDFIAIILSEGQRLSRLVESVLEYASIEAGSVAWQMDEIPLQELILVSLKLFEPVCRERGISLDQGEKSSAIVVADRARMQKVLANVLDNALKFTPEGGRIQVQVFDEDESVVIKVQDSGCGIDPKHREEAFQCLSQLGDHLTAKPPGAGLGLALCRRIMERHQGTIACVDPDPEFGGACITLRLPTL